MLIMEVSFIILFARFVKSVFECVHTGGGIDDVGRLILSLSRPTHNHLPSSHDVEICVYAKTDLSVGINRDDFDSTSGDIIISQ